MDLLKPNGRYRLTAKNGEMREGVTESVPQTFTFWAESGPQTATELMFFKDPDTGERFMVRREDVESVEHIPTERSEIGNTVEEALCFLRPDRDREDE